MPDAGHITQLLSDWRSGSEAAQGELFDAVYDELRNIARRHHQRWSGNDTLNTTALVHELYIKLDRAEQFGAENRAHFFRIASRAMRQILINYSKERKRQKRGGDVQKVTLGAEAEREALIDRQADHLLDIDSAMTKLQEMDERLGQVAELHFFGGLSYDEISETLGIGRATVARDWQVAKAWLRTELAELDDRDTR